MLILPNGATITSGGSPHIIGDMNGGASETVTWNIVLQKNGTHSLEVRASGHDSNGEACFASASATIQVGEGTVNELSPSSFGIAAVIAILWAAIPLSALFLWRRRRASYRRT